MDFYERMLRVPHEQQHPERARRGCVELNQITKFVEFTEVSF